MGGSRSRIDQAPGLTVNPIPLALWVFLISVFAWLPVVQAELRDCELAVSGFESDDSIRWKSTTKQRMAPLPDEIYVVHSQWTERALGFVIIQSATLDGNTSTGTARVEVHGKEGLVKPGDCLIRVDLTREDPNLPARFDLMRASSKSASSRYQPLVYTGFVFGQTAANLAPREWILGPGIAGYGVTPGFQLDLSPIYAVLGEPNIGFKGKLLEREDYRLTLGTRGYFDLSREDPYGELSLYFDTYSNSRFASYNRIKLQTRRARHQGLNPESPPPFISAELNVFYGVLLPNWDRLVLGPIFNFVDKTLGGSLGYVMVNDRFSWMFGVQSTDFLNSSLKRGTLSYVIDAWWRF